VLCNFIESQKRDIEQCPKIENICTWKAKIILPDSCYLQFVGFSNFRVGSWLKLHIDFGSFFKKYGDLAKLHQRIKRTITIR
jgi:hypothetical protein